MSHNHVELGLGLIGIGKPWGQTPHEVPSETAAIGLLEFAWQLGIRYFDTAPSYGDGVSEARLGRFLRSLPPDQRDQATGATKFGEHWDRASGAPYADHSYDALCRSLDRSAERLGRIDVLQLHKTTPHALASDEVARAWEYAASLGIEDIGPSVSEPESARMALSYERYSIMQLPYNREYRVLEEFVGPSRLRLAINRPFAMGAMAGEDKAACFRFILERGFQGVVLTGTISPDHLQENWQAFHAAQR